MRYELFSRRTLMNGKQWFWRLVAGNGRKIAVSGEGYHNKADCRHALELVRGSAHALVKELD